MISVVVPTLNADKRIAKCLTALCAPACSDLVKEVIVVDGGSFDDTVKVAGGYGAKILTSPPGRGGQLAVGACAAKGDWLLFLHADTVLAEGWENEAAQFIEDHPKRVGVFTLRFDARGFAPRIVAAGAMVRTKVLKTPYGDQGLLISRRLYDEVGGFADMPLMEDVEFINRLVRFKGRGILHVLASKAVTSAERYERDGYARRVFKNLWTLVRYSAGASPEKLAKSYC